MLKQILVLWIVSLIFGSNVNKADTVQTKIVGGTQFAPHKYPFLVGIAIKEPTNRAGWCGGALITTDFVLSAAHCLKGITFATVYIGAHNVRNHSMEVDYICNITQQNIILHRNWTSRYVVHDIALINLPISVTIGPTIQTIQLIENDMSIYTGLKLTAIGWGRTSNNATAKRPDTPYSTDLRILDDLECEKLYHYYNSTYNICVEGNELYSICRGDSGGPLIKIDSQSNDYVAVGLISYGRRCNNPTVLTRLSYYVDWINIHLNTIH